ncbi:MAG: 50S ribosomal protein L24 [Kiritimatiellaeota bacterium]|nr:50S ribosomal protein L24 [Kiritimatiellota bacterium]
MSISRIKVKDTVIAIAGASAGKTGTVVKIDRIKERAIVEGLNMRKKTVRRSQEMPDGGILDKEGWIHLSNLMPYDPKLKKGVRIARVKEGDTFVRVGKGSGHRFA